MSNSKYAKITYFAICVALVFVSTMLAIPLPSGAGYINLGDSAIIILAFLFGPLAGGIAGGLGSALADIVGGFAIYSPFSLVIKGGVGALLGILCGNTKKLFLSQLPIWILCELIIVVCYFLVDIVFFGAITAIAGIGYSAIQVAINVLIVSLVYKQIFRILVLKRLAADHDINMFDSDNDNKADNRGDSGSDYDTNTMADATTIDYELIDDDR